MRTSVWLLAVAHVAYVLSTHPLIERVVHRAIQAAREEPWTLQNSGDNSWVRGTLQEALTELYDPKFSPFGSDPNATCWKDYERPEPLCTFVDELLQDRLYGLSIASGNATELLPQRRLFNTSTAGDPGSLGVSVLLCSKWASKHNRTVYFEAANSQLNIQLYETLRNGSYRQEFVQAWSDQGYMTPPFLSMAGLYQHNKTTMLEGARQNRLEYDILFNRTAGLMQHVLGAVWSDTHLWATGNSWWSAGATRVLGVLAHSPWANDPDVLVERRNLTALVAGIIKTSYQYINETDGLINNDMADPEPSFGDASSTALMAAAAYRIAVLDPDSMDGCDNDTTVSLAIRANGLLRNETSFGVDDTPVSVALPTYAPSLSLASSTMTAASSVSPSNATQADAGSSSQLSTMEITEQLYHAVWRRVDRDGWLHHAVDPLNWTRLLSDDERTPEGQSFVVLMYAARQAWLKSKTDGDIL